MSDHIRTGLTIVFLIVIGFGTWKFWQAERAADRVYVKLGAVGRRRIRGRISRGKRFIVAVGLLLLLAFQNLTDLLYFIPGWEEVADPLEPLGGAMRGLCIMAAMIAWAIAGDDINVGYRRWDEDMDLFLADDEEPAA